MVCKSLLADRIGTATPWMQFECQDLHETLCFFGQTERPLRRKVDSLARRLPASSLCRRICLELSAQWNRWFQVTVLFFVDAVLLCSAMFCMCCDTLCIGTGASKRCVPQSCVAILLCLAAQSVQIAVEWLRQGVSKGTWSPVVSCDCIVFCKSLLADLIGNATSRMRFEC